MFAKLKSVKPCLNDNDDFFEFDVQVEFQGWVRTISCVTAEKLLDQYEFAVLVAESLGCLMQRESDWRQVLADVWDPPRPIPSAAFDFDDDDDIVLTEEWSTAAEEEAA
ncbi:MAG: hypothetical protein AB7I48_19350 [Planctomycetaceae bacterium]